MKLYFKSLKLAFFAEIQYRWSFILSFISQFLIFFTYFLLLTSLFEKFGNIKGYSLYEVLLMFSIVQLGYNISAAFFAGIDKFEKLIIQGEFDRLLLRPKNIMLLILCSDFRFNKIAKLLQSLLFLIFSLYKLNLDFSLYKIFVLLLIIVGSSAIFLSIFILNASLCFYTIEGLEVSATITYGCREAAQYPIEIYGKKGIMFFTFIIPFGLISYYPILYLIGRSINPLYGLTPIFIIIFLFISLLIFKKTSRRYLSTGS